jgi:hypothetical protein
VPFEDLTGNSGFTSDSEGAEANLDINMSEDSARNLWDVQAAVQQIATDFQTAVRAAADFNSYLISIRETSQTVRMPSLGMEGGENGNMSYSGGRVDTGSVPFIQSEIGQAQRIGEMEENATGMGGGAMAARAPGAGLQAGEVVNQLTQAAWLASATGQGQNEVPQETAAAYNQDYNWALRHRKSSMVTTSQYGGQSGTARTFAASRLIANNLPAAQQFLTGGGGGGIAAAFGRIGIAGALGYTGYQLVDAGLETYAQSRALAISANNSQYGAGWGLEQRANQSIMAMSPFISGEEAAQIYSAAVQQGWASRAGGFAQGDFSSAVNFMYGAAKDYNLSPQASAQLLQTNALGAGESVQALAEQLATLKKSLDGTGVSMETATSTFSDFTSFLVGQGASPGDAARIAGGAINSFAGNTYLGPNASGAQSFMAAMQSTQVQNIVGGLTGNIGGAAFAGTNADRGVAALQGVIHSLAVQYSSMTGTSIENRAALFRIAYNQLTGQNIDPKFAQQFMMEAAANPDFATKGQDTFNQSATIKTEHQNAFQDWWHGLDDLHGWASTQTGNKQSIADQEKNSALINTYSYYSPQINTLLDNAGDNLQNFVLYGPDGKPVMADGNRVAGANIAKWYNENYAKFNDPKSGYYIQGPGGKEDTYNAVNIGAGGNTAGATAAGGNAANTVYITLSDEAKKYFNTNTDKVNLPDGKTHY